jgi:NAD(P)-dependent dehydrogenase (short-subunit alcohol dehydrogenase family)
VNLSTGLTRVSAPGWSAYAAVKGAIEVLTVYMAKELGSRGIAVNVVAPGAIETDFFGGAGRDTPDFNKFFSDMTALGRVGLRHRADDRGAPHRGQSLGQCPADRGVGRPGNLKL